MIKQILVLSILAVVSFKASAQNAQQCNAMSTDLSNARAGFTQCEADHNAVNSQVQAALSDNQRLQAEVNQIAEIRNSSFPRCQQDLINRPTQIANARQELTRVQAQVAAKNSQLNTVQTEFNSLERNRFISYQCVIKDREYGAGGFGEGNSEAQAEANAVADDSTQMARKHGYEKICFKVYQAR